MGNNFSMNVILSRVGCRVISKNQYCRKVEVIKPHDNSSEVFSYREFGSIEEFMNKQLCNYYTTISCFLIKFTIMRFYDPTFFGPS